MNDRAIDAESTPRADFPKWWHDSGKYLCAHGSDGVVLQMMEVAAQRGYMAGFRRALDMQAAPQQAAERVPLTDEQVMKLRSKYPYEDVCIWSYNMGVADAEAAHGIIKGGQP